jgi:hypothetical protein
MVEDYNIYFKLSEIFFELKMLSVNIVVMQRKESMKNEI